MKKLLSAILALTLGLSVLSGCRLMCTHEWQNATCTAPQICSLCQKAVGEPIAHAWVGATCTEAEHCSMCNQTKAPATGHVWQEASCTEAKHCTVCNVTEGSLLDHNYSETALQPASCQHEGLTRYSCNLCSHSYEESVPYPEYDASTIYEMATLAVGEVITYNKAGSELKLGSCFVYSTDGKIVTNYHVIEDAYSAKITINQKSYPVQSVLAYDKVLDLAVLKVSASDLTALKICAETHAVGKTVYAFGSSRGMTATFSKGIITYADRVVDGVHCVQHDAAISTGNSGGPLINQYGEIIGVNSWGLTNSQNLNFAVSVSELDNLTYGTPLSMSQFFEKECDPFVKLKNYAIQNGKHNTSYDEYILLLGTQYSSDYTTKYQRVLYYDVPANALQLCLFIDGEDYVVVVNIDKIDGSYGWVYYDAFYNYMGGTLYSTTFSTNTLLGYDDYDISSSYTLASIRKLASEMVAYLASNMDSDFASLGVSAEDLGFYYF